MTLPGHDSKEHDYYYKQQTLLICRTLQLTIFFTTPLIGGVVKCWLNCLGLDKEKDDSHS